MGKATIVSGGPGGEYVATPLRRRAHIDAELQSLATALESVNENLLEYEEAVPLAEQTVIEARWVVESMIETLYGDLAAGTVDLNRVITEHNLQRSRKGIGALKGAAALHNAAQSHARWLAENDTSGHLGANGSRPCQRILNAGYDWTSSPGACGENVVVGPAAFSVDAAMDLWMSSVLHRDNILDKDFEHIGVGYALRTDRSIYRHFWVVKFGAPSAGHSVSLAGAGEPQIINVSGALLPLDEAFNQAQINLVMAAKARDIMVSEQATLLARRDVIERRAEMLNAIPADIPLPAWCVDYTENLSGTVATIEINGEGADKMVLRPGGTRQYVPTRDGQLYHREGMTGPQVYFNAAVLPGWQRHKPTYRVGTLTTVDYAEHTCSVTLDAATSSAQNLPINAASALSSVPIVYMECNSEPFEPGDRVVVELVGNDWESPRVIGFESHPRPCNLDWPTVTMPILHVEEQIGAYPPSQTELISRVRWHDACQHYSYLLTTSDFVWLGLPYERKIYTLGSASSIRQEVDGTADRWWKLNGTWRKWDVFSGSWVVSAAPNPQLSHELEEYTINIPFKILYGYNLQTRYEMGVESSGFPPDPLWIRALIFPSPQIINLPDRNLDLDCSNNLPVQQRTVIYGHTPVDKSSLGDARPMPPGFVVSDNPPPEASTWTNITKYALTEEILIRSNQPAALLNWFRANGIPETIQMAQTKDGVTHAKTYWLRAIDTRPSTTVSPGTTEIWSAVYRPTPP